VVVAGGDAVHVFEPNQRVAHPGQTGACLEEQTVAWGLGEEPIVLEFASGARLDLGEEAVVRIGRGSIDLFKGWLRVDLTNARGPFTVSTPWGEFAGEGAVFSVQSSADEGAARLSVIAGEVTVDARGATRTLPSGSAITLKPDPRRVMQM